MEELTVGETGDVEWISWDEASRRTGLPVPTVEHAVRVQRIERRPQAGSAPTLDASSVDAWASWYRERQTHKQQGSRRARSTTEALPPGKWLTTAEAAGVLGLESPGTVMWHAHRGDLEVHRGAARAWVSEASVLAFVEDRATWISWASAADIVGCTIYRISRLVEQGHLTHRSVRRTRRSVTRASAEAYAPVYATQQLADQRRQEELEAAKGVHPAGPLPDGDMWLDVTTASLVIGLTRSGVLNRIHADLIPAALAGRQYWLSRRVAEQASAVRAFHLLEDN